jgi:drug/metabolite transporter (DMT)-like permease
MGVALLYRAFAIGPISVAAPVVSIVALCMPVMVGLARGERPSALAITGIALAALSFPLLSRTVDHADSRSSARRVLPAAFASGVLVGGFLVLIRQISPDSGLVPLIAARLATVVLFGLIVALSREPFLPAREVAPATLGSGLLDSGANIAYFIAVHRGSLAICGTIVSLAPAVTVLLARLVLGERWSRAQHFGLALAMAAIVCVSLGG